MTRGAGPRWSEADVERLKELWASGLSSTQIAEAFGGVPRHRIHSKIDALQLPVREKDAGRYPDRLPKRRSHTGAERMALWRANNREKSLKAHAEWQRKWRASPEGKRQKRDAALRAAYGITLVQFEAMVAAQDGVCVICQRELELGTRRVAVDHDHDTGKIRGVLCSPCNTALGSFEDDPDRLSRAILYLRQYTEE